MGMSTHVKGFRPPDEKWQQMKTVYDACVAAGISVPDEVSSFFDYRRPDPRGVEVDLARIDGVVVEWQNDSSAGLEIDVRKLPPDLHVVRFYNSW